MPQDDRAPKCPPKNDDDRPGVSRRDFLKISSISAAAAPFVARPTVVRSAGKEVPVYGPGKVPMELSINGKKRKASFEPRVTLLDALRDHFELTGAKRVCDRGECGACTVLMNNSAVYACMVLAIEAQEKQITTVESFMQGNKLHPVQQAFVDNDASQCGFCTPGFVVACKAFLDKHPNPTPEDIRRGVSGNFCRCAIFWIWEGSGTFLSLVAFGRTANAAAPVRQNRLFRRIPDLRFATPLNRLRWRPGLVLRGLESLPVAFSKRTQPGG